MVKLVNPPLSINVHIIDIKTDKEEREVKYHIKKVTVDLSKFRSFNDAKEEHDKQTAGLARKYKSIMDLVIWAMNNNKELHFVNADTEQDEK